MDRAPEPPPAGPPGLAACHPTLVHLCRREVYRVGQGEGASHRGLHPPVAPRAVLRRPPSPRQRCPLEADTLGSRGPHLRRGVPQSTD